MATKTEERRATRSILFPAIAIAVAAIVLIAVALAIWGEGDPSEGGIVGGADIETRPTGAGTLPDGSVDENVEGMRNQTSTGDFVDQTTATDDRPEILDADNGPDPAPSVEELETERTPAELPPSVEEEPETGTTGN